MNHNIFIRSYKGDIQWLKYCVKGIKKFVTGYNKLVIVVPHSEVPLFTAEGFDVVGCDDLKDGYMGQQVTKLMADTYFKEETEPFYITYFDSDCITKEKLDLSEYIINGKVIWLVSQYANLVNANPNPLFWRPITERALGSSVTLEFMRKVPITIRSDDLRGVRRHMVCTHGISIKRYIETSDARNFSEFNLMGAYCHKFSRGRYNWIDAEVDGIPYSKTINYWSWGGLDKHISEIEEFTK